MGDSGHTRDRDLFDLPLEPVQKDEAAAASQPAEPEPPAPAEPGPLPLFPELQPAPRPRRTATVPLAAAAAAAAAAKKEEEPLPLGPRPVEAPQPLPPEPAGLGRRWLAGGFDVAIHGAVAGVLTLGAWLLGARVDPGGDLVALGLFLVVFSFLYSVVPLAFWGQTPGMQRLGVTAQNHDGGPLTFGQVFARWLGSLLTLGTLGLPSLLALLGGRSLTDRLSASGTYQPGSPG